MRAQPRSLLLALAVSAALLVPVLPPALATHPHASIPARYIAASIQTDAFVLPVGYCANWFWGLGQGCLGGGFPQVSQHDPNDPALGYENVLVLVTDDLSGSQVGTAACLRPAGAALDCSEDDPLAVGCGITLLLSTKGAFRTTFALVSVQVLYMDGSTSQVCLGSRGSLVASFWN